MNHRDGLLASVIRVDLDIVVINRVGRIQADDRSRGQQPVADNPIEQFRRVLVQRRRLLSDGGIVQNGREFSAELPRLEEGSPIDAMHELVEGIRLKHLWPQRGRSGWLVCGPAQVDPTAPSFGDRQEGGLCLAMPVRLADFGVLVPMSGRELVPLVGVQECTHHTDAARRVEDMDRWAVVLLVDLHGRMYPRRGRPADQERSIERQALHLFGDVHHLVERRSDEATQSDDVDLLFARGLQNLLAWHHHTEIDDLVIVALQHHAHDLLADVVDIPLDGGEQDLAIRRTRLPALFLLLVYERHEMGDGLFHDSGTLDHLR